MEWMLQVLDEVDDAIGALQFCCAGFAAEFALVAAAALGIGAIGAAVAMGAELSLICVAAMSLALAGALKLRDLQLQARPEPLSGDPSPL